VKEQAQRFRNDDATVDSVDSVFSFDTMDSSLSLETLFDFESSASMSTTESNLSEASLDSVVDTMVGETIRCATYVYKPVVDCDIDFVHLAPPRCQGNQISIRCHTRWSDCASVW
jgi:hypothetical protein